MKNIFLVLFILFLLSCNSTINPETFIVEEENRIKNIVEEIFIELGYDNFEVFTNYHRDLGNNAMGKRIQINRVVGSGLLPMVDSLTYDGYSVSMTNEFDDFYERRDIAVNYDLNAPLAVVYEYLSILIVFDSITVDEKNELLKILSLYVMNSNRGDIAYIISKD